MLTLAASDELSPAVATIFDEPSPALDAILDTELSSLCSPTLCLLMLGHDEGAPTAPSPPPLSFYCALTFGRARRTRVRSLGMPLATHRTCTLEPIVGR